MGSVAEHGHRAISTEWDGNGKAQCSHAGVELDNLKASTLLRLMLLCGQLGTALGFYGGFYAAARLFTDKDERRRRAMKLAGGAATVAALLSVIGFKCPPLLSMLS